MLFDEQEAVPMAESGDAKSPSRKVVFILGSTGSGKSKLAVNLATHFPSEVINSDKIQIHKGLDITTNKIPESEQQGIPHHLLSVIEADDDFTVQEFCNRVLVVIDEIANRGKTPIIAGGSNSYIEELVQQMRNHITLRYECCFIWLDVSLSVLFRYLSDRVDQMVEAGLVDEIREIFVPDADYNTGIRQAIGVREMDTYLKVEVKGKECTEKLLKAALDEMKENTCKLATKQVSKIKRMKEELGWDIHRIDATAVHQKSGKESKNAYENEVLKPSVDIVGAFLEES